MNDFTGLLAGCRAGDERAYRRLVDKYLPYLERAIRRKMPDPLRRRFNTSDFAQQVWASFVVRPLADLDLPTERALIAYLMGMAERKVKEEVRHQLAQAHGGDRTVPLDDAHHPADAAPTPSTLMAADERLDAITDGLPARQREMVRMLAVGHSADAVGRMFDLNEKTVRRLLELIRSRHPVGGAV